MKSISILIYIILLLTSFKINYASDSYSKMIIIPFKFTYHKSSSFSYNATSYLNENYKKKLILELNLGTPLQKINAYLNQDSPCFELKKIELNNESNDIKYYYPNKSESFKVNGVNHELPWLINCFDFFYFFENKQKYLLTFALEYKDKEIEDKTTDIKTKNYSYIPDIGISQPVMYIGSNCPNFIYDLKTLQLISKRIFNIKYYNKFEGEFIIGDNLAKYPKAKVNENDYISKYFYSEFLFSYNSIMMKNSQNKIDYVNITDDKITQKALINLNNGFIIGTEDFKNYIHKTYFKFLVEKGICDVDLVKYNNITKEKLGNEFYLYHCNYMKLTGQYNQRHGGINYFKEFPNLIIRSIYFEYDFELTNQELFEQIYSRYYFLIIFRKNYPKNEKNTWYLGEPFYKKYPFTIDFDANTLGFYLNKNDKKENKETINSDEDENNIKENIDNNNNDISNNSKIKKIFIKIGEIIIGIILLILAYYIGMKVKEGRKKRANELKDDYYEYIQDDKKDININDNTNSKKGQTLELNSKLGL